MTNATEDDRILAKDIIQAFRRKFSPKYISEMLGINRKYVYFISLMSTRETKDGPAYMAPSESVMTVIRWWDRTGGVIDI